MMQEMYEWYMDNLFPEHRRQAIKHAEKDGRDRKKRLQRAGPEDRSVLSSDRFVEHWSPTSWGTRSFGPNAGISKWDRIGAPFVASVVDWAIIINPWDFVPETGWQKRKASAIGRQIDRFHELSN